MHKTLSHFLNSLQQARARLPRMLVCMLLAASTLAGILFLSPQQGPVLLYKLVQVFLGGVVGYWVDRWAFPYARPDGYLNEEWRRGRAIWPDNKADFEVERQHQLVFAAAMVRRALIIAGAMLAVGLGL